MPGTSSSALFCGSSSTVEDPDLAVLNEVDNTPSKKPVSGSIETGAVKDRTMSGLINAMKRKSKNAVSPIQPRQSSGAAEDLDPFRYAPSSEPSTISSDKDSVYDEDQDGDSDDSNPVVGRRQSRRRASNLGPNRKSGNTNKSSTAKTSAVRSKRKREEEPVGPEKKYATYHDEAKRRNIAPKIMYEAERQSLGVITKKPWLYTPKPKIQISGLQFGSPSRSISFSFPVSQVINDELSVKERKRFFIYTPTDAIKEAMRTHVSNVHQLFPPYRGIGDCMLHPNPRGLLKNGKYHQTIVCNYKWKDASGIHTIGVNFGIVALIVNHHLTSAQKEGFIQDAWHLSHLCCNWICCNWRHHTVEPGPVNIGRNACFNSSDPCKHDPRCMKDKKVALNLPTSPATPGSGQALAELSMNIEGEAQSGEQEVELVESDAEEDVESDAEEDVESDAEEDAETSSSGDDGDEE